MRDRFHKFYDLWFNDRFVQFTKELSFKLNNILCEDLKEVESVKKWVDTFNNTNEFNDNGVSIKFNSVFIHGFDHRFNHYENGSHPSGVEFDYLNNSKSKKELGDILFISSFCENNQKYLEKISINQTKWGVIKKTTSTWEIDEKQLYLISRFPRFNGVNGSIIPNCDFNIEDYSKGLGSYGLMTKENFIYVSALDVLQFIGGKKSINLNDLKNCQRNEFHPDVFWYVYSDLIRFSKLYCGNTYEFVTEYLRGKIGEVIDGEHNTNKEAKRLLNHMLSNIKSYSQQTNNQNVINFLNNYGDFTDSDNLINNNIDLNGNFGIIQMKINLDNEKLSNKA